jgi:hypothetical protein
MSNEIALPTIEGFKAKVTEQMKAVLGQLIPDEAWAALIDAEWKKFTNDTRDRNGETVASGLSKMIRVELDAQMSGLVKEWVNAWMKPTEANEKIRISLARIAEIAAKSYMDKIGEEITLNTLNAMGNQYRTCQNCRSITRAGYSCSKCGT